MNRITGMKAISFDVDGTLWDFESVMRLSLGHVLEELKRINSDAAAKLDVERMITIRERVGEELKGRVVNLGQVRLEAFRETLREAGSPDDTLAAHLNQVFLRQRFQNLTLFDDVLPTLRALQKKYTLGVLSNGNTYPERCGLEGIFQFAVFSQDHNVAKPDPGLFQKAVEAAGCSKQELLHVGDSLEDDVMGAMNAGIKCVWVNRNRMKSSSGLEIEHEISSLSDLPDVLSTSG